MFLEFRFHDTDFSSDATKVLTEIWRMVDYEISAHSDSTERTTSEALVYLHTEGLLRQMVKKLMVLSAASHDVWWAALGVHKKDIFASHDKIKLASNGIARLEEYFDDIEIELHETKEFSDKWMNSECAWLDLDTCDTGLF